MAYATPVDFTFSFPTTFTVTPSTSTGSKPMPFTIKTAQIKAGHVGQVWFESRIVWESSPRKSALKARKAAERRRAQKVAALFT